MSMDVILGSLQNTLLSLAARHTLGIDTYDIFPICDTDATWTHWLL